MRRENLEQAGPPRSINLGFDGEFRFEAAIPIAAAPTETPATGTVTVRESYGGRAIRVVHSGSYAGLPATRRKARAWIAAHGYQPAGAQWDEYTTDPGEVSEAELTTELYFPVR